MATARIRPPIDFLKTGIENLQHQVVGVVVVIAVFVGPVDKPLAQNFLVREIPIQNFYQLRQWQVGAVSRVGFVKAKLPHRTEAIRHAPQPHHLNEGVVVTGAARVVVQSLLDAIIDEHAEEWRGHVVGVHPFDEAAAPDLQVNEMPELRAECREEIFESLERVRCAGAQAQLFASARIDPVMEREFQHFHQVEVAG